MDNADPQARATEIENLIISNELNAATKRLMDFVTDFSGEKKHKYEVIIIRATYNSLSEDIRLFGKTEAINIRLTKLISQILEFVESIIREYQPTEREITRRENLTSIQPEDLQKKIEIRDPVSWDDKDITLTQLELDKKRFVEAKKLEKLSSSSIVFEDNGISKLEKPSSSSIVFEGKGISKIYKSRSIKFKLSNLALSLKLGEITAVVGENGNGKTTLLRIIAGELAASTGELSYPYLTLNNKTDIYSFKQKMAYIPQELPKWSGLLADNLHLAAAIHGIRGDDNKDEVNFIIARLGLEKYKKANWNEISGGYKMRFSLAKALISNPQLVILDEPLANLDINTQVVFLQDLRDLANSSANPIAVIISSQHLYEVESIANNIIFIKDGQVIYHGSVQNFGEDRKENSYEIACDLSKQQIIDLFDQVKFNYNRLEKAGNSFIIHTARNVTNTDILRILVEQNISLKYFRDISKSTRKLFDKQS
ncbi:ABC transporter ATP-binding protein [Nostoc sp. UHCC 0251]|uniref:ABC transporter ATP-binding protein n=1 Tax=Nostoc sp. UHCC 0251 TaxID=3110240 RepID=UPI002B1EC650|nr:ABC transporter ATP-binding protein [Nostoc sp. UHCC 0251]MEA5622446.1 ABC transporter ATP-binding protein [Nostoc sp. UHCC 0251]